MGLFFISVRETNVDKKPNDLSFSNTETYGAPEESVPDNRMTHTTPPASRTRKTRAAVRHRFFRPRHYRAPAHARRWQIGPIAAS